MKILLALAALLLSLNLQAADYAREKNWADEVLPSILTGDPVWLKQVNGHEFLGLFTESDNKKTGVIVVHGIGVHPDWGLISPLRQQLPEAGYATLSVQMPILQADAKGDAYPPTFPEAAERLNLAVGFLKGKGYQKVAIVSHSLGSRMSHHFLAGNPDSGVAAWVAIGAPAPLDMTKLNMPVLDLYGQNDLPAVLENASKRAAGLKQTGSTQIVVPGADHFFNGKEAELLELTRTWLGKTL